MSASKGPVTFYAQLARNGVTIHDDQSASVHLKTDAQQVAPVVYLSVQGGKLLKITLEVVPEQELTTGRGRA